MKRFFFKATIFSLAFMLIGLGCKGPSAEEQAAVRPVTLEYWTVYEDVAMLRQFASEYKQAHPFVTINIRQVRYDEFDSLFTNALADDVGPDMVSLHAHWMNKYQPRLAPMPSSVRVAQVSVEGEYRQETVITLNNYTMPTPRSIQTDYVSTVAEDAIIAGDVYGLPLSMDTMALYYNKDLLDRAGVATPPTTWEEFMDAVQETTTFGADGRIIQSGVALGTGNNIDNAADIFALLMQQRNSPVTNGRSVTLANNIKQLRQNHPAFEVLRFYTDFAQPTKEVYSWNTEKGNAFDAFVQGQSAFYLGYAFDAERIAARAPQMTVEVVSLPQLDPTRPANIANYWLQSVVKKSEHQNVAWDFIRYATTERNTKRYVDATALPSPLRVHIAEQAEDPILEPFVTQMLTAKNWYRGRNVDVAKEALADMINEYAVPIFEGEEQIKRDMNILQNTASIIQQTM